MSDDQFSYTTAQGETITIPHVRNVAVGTMRRVRKLDQLDATFTILEELCDAGTMDVLDGMNLEEFRTFADAWDAASRVSVGESSASST